MLSKEARVFAADALALEDWEEGVRRFEALAKERTPNSGRLLVELVDHRKVWIRERALDTLWAFGRLVDARRAARIAIHSKSYFVRDIAAEMMEQVGTKADVPALVGVLQSDKYWVARASAASSLGEHRTGASIDALRNAVSKDRQWMVRAYAVNGLCRYGESRFLPLIEERIKRDPEPAVLPSHHHAMVMMGREEHLEKIIDLLFVPDHWFMVYIRTCVVLRELFLEEGKPLPDRAIKGLRHVAKTQFDRASGWSAHDLLRDAGFRAPKKKVPTSTSSGKSRA